eukprot:811387-Prorocentrum_minimum.AAC.1
MMTFLLVELYCSSGFAWSLTYLVRERVECAVDGWEGQLSYKRALLGVLLTSYANESSVLLTFGKGT